MIFDPVVLAKFKGEITVLDSLRELVSTVLMYLGKPANTTNPVDWKAVRDVILKAEA